MDLVSLSSLPQVIEVNLSCSQDNREIHKNSSSPPGLQSQVLLLLWTINSVGTKIWTTTCNPVRVSFYVHYLAELVLFVQLKAGPQLYHETTDSHNWASVRISWEMRETHIARRDPQSFGFCALGLVTSQFILLTNPKKTLGCNWLRDDTLRAATIRGKNHSTANHSPRAEKDYKVI